MVAAFSVSDYRYLGGGGTDWREILHDGTHRSRTDLPFLERYSRGSTNPNFWPKFLPFDCEYLENGKSQRYMSIRAYHRLDEGFLKMYRVIAPPGKCCPPPVWRVCVFLTHLLLVALFCSNVTGKRTQNFHDTFRVDERWFGDHAIKFARWQHPAVAR